MRVLGLYLREKVRQGERYRTYKLYVLRCLRARTEIGQIRRRKPRGQHPLDPTAQTRTRRFQFVE